MALGLFVETLLKRLILARVQVAILGRGSFRERARGVSRGKGPRGLFGSEQPDPGESTANLVKGKGRFNRVEMYRRVFVRFRHGNEVLFTDRIKNITAFRISTQRTLRQQTIPYLQKRTPVRTGKLRASLDSNVEIQSVRDGYLEVRYRKDGAYYGRWVARARDLLSSQALLNRMRKAFREGAVASQESQD